jgi:hypothetical protein
MYAHFTEKVQSAIPEGPHIFYCMILLPVVYECDNSTFVVVFYEHGKKPVGPIKVENALLQ